ncbi:Pyrroline-5-carboxylate reductase [Caligus rogercresseyi]|uniref:pyrroline-5-carboxylate reductase n=1 Tax=Caligus rogercresseyi TaxID=217165 RepID=A0A7T8KJT1_CALRO|nr:Pyrroline-5-carboxylate reductase [Caligus rogercresseyi]
MAGISLRHISSCLSSTRIFRIMTNTASSLGAACSAYTFVEGASPTIKEDEDLVKQTLSMVGSCEKLPESNFHAFTGLAGSGPAFVYTILEALADGAVLSGLPRATARKFAAQMALGASKMALESGKHTGELKDAVTSPAGTTISGVAALERGKIRGVLMEAVQASSNRSKELSGEK